MSFFGVGHRAMSAAIGIVSNVASDLFTADCALLATHALEDRELVEECLHAYPLLSAAKTVAMLRASGVS